MSIGKNIERLRLSRGMSMNTLASKIGTYHPQISRWEASKRVPTIDWIEKIAKALDYSVSEVLGYENLGIQPLPTNESQLDKTSVNNKKFSSNLNPLKDSPTREVPMYNQDFSCGPGAVPLEHLDATIFNIDVKILTDLTTSTNSVVIIKAKGDSMYPTINDKDLVLVDTSIKQLKNSSKSTNIYAFRYEDRLCLKKLTFKDRSKTSIIAESLNDKTTNNPFEITFKNNPDFAIIGKVIGSVKRFS